jgi:cAMP phosphodiesterase
MKLQLLPSSFDENGLASEQQHLSCFVINDSVAVDAGSLAMATNSLQKKQIRDVVLTHAHLDHIAGLPLFIDDLFDILDEPIRVYATREVIEVLKRDIFNWAVYPNFLELENKKGTVLKYRAFEVEREIVIKDLTFKPIEVNHLVPSIGYVISDGKTKIALTGDTAETDEFWRVINTEKNISAILIECAFPDQLKELAQSSHHLTPKILRKEIEKYTGEQCPIYVVNIKPMCFEEVVRQIKELNIENLQILQVGKVYEWI